MEQNTTFSMPLIICLSNNDLMNPLCADLLWNKNAEGALFQKETEKYSDFRN